jgi:hypothetical protein
MAFGLEADGSLCIGYVVKIDQKVLFGQYCHAFLCPFDYANAFAIKIFVQPQVYNFLDAAESLTMTKEGLKAYSFTSSPQAMPCVRHVLPFPRLPVRRNTSPA